MYGVMYACDMCEIGSENPAVAGADGGGGTADGGIGPAVGTGPL